MSLPEGPSLSSHREVCLLYAAWKREQQGGRWTYVTGCQSFTLSPAQVGVLVLNLECHIAEFENKHTFPNLWQKSDASLLCGTEA